MAMLKANSPWPVPDLADAIASFKEYGAWYQGDPTALEKFYQGVQPNVRPSQLAGGIVGAAARLFWGRPSSAVQSRRRIHVPIAGDISTASADLLFADPPRFGFPRTEKEPATATGGTVGEQVTALKKHPEQDRLEELAGSDSAITTYRETAEYASAFGSGYMRIVWNVDTMERASFTSVAPDGVVPEFEHGNLIAVSFVQNVRPIDGVKLGASEVLRHVEYHYIEDGNGYIEHALYLGKYDNLGSRVPLTDSEDTKGIVVDENSRIFTGSKFLSAAYIPNMTPNKDFRSNPYLASLGRSDYANGATALFDAADETMTSWMRDVRMSRQRIIVDKSAMDDLGPGGGASFDDDREVFQPIQGVGSLREGAPVTSIQGTIRYAEHEQTLAGIMRSALRSAGLSAASFGDGSLGATVETATQVRAKEKQSNRTRDKKMSYWTAALPRFLRALLDIDRFQWGRTDPQTTDLPQARFPEDPTMDQREIAETIQLLRAAKVLSQDAGVKMQHPDWEQDKVDEEVARIGAEQKASEPDAFSFRGEPVAPDAAKSDLGKA